MFLHVQAQEYILLISKKYDKLFSQKRLRTDQNSDHYLS